MRTSILLRYSPLTIATVGGLIAVLESLLIVFGTVAIFGLAPEKLSHALFLTMLCPALIAPPMIYFPCLAVHRGESARRELAATNQKLELALTEVRELKGLLPLCAWCNKVRDDEGYWSKVDAFLHNHTRAEITHSICPECSAREISRIPPIR